MPAARNRIPDEALSSHDDYELEFGHPGPAILGLDKEALLTRLTTRRSQSHHAVIDYIFREAARKNAYVYTTTHVLAEVIGTIRSGDDPSTVESFWNDLQESTILVLEDGREWKKPPVDDTGEAVFSQPFQQFQEVQRLYQEYPSIDFKFHEATLVFNGILLEERATSSFTVYIATFDGAVAALASALQLDVLPYRTPLREDSDY
jgi:hypothetical protein